MANIIQIKRGLKANIDKLSLMPGELGVTLDTQELYVGDVDGNKQIIKAGAAGSVESAGKLTTARNIGIIGDATGSAAFDGSQDINIAIALAKSGVAAGTYTKVTVDDAGRVITGATLETKDLPTITITNVDGLQAALDAKVATTTLNNTVEGINSAIALKADKTDLTTKANVGDSYTKAEADDLLAVKANAADVYTQTEVTNKLAGKADKGTTLGEYGIGDAYTKTDVDGFLASYYTSSQMDGKLALKADVSALNELNTNLTAEINKKATAATTLEGYGITDAYTKTEVDAKVASVYKYKGSVDNEAALPTEGQVVGDVYDIKDTGMNVAWNGSDWDKLGIVVDLSGYLLSETASATYATKQSLAEGLDTKANTADVYNKEKVDELIAAKDSLPEQENQAGKFLTTNGTTASWATVDLSGKADKATTLAGYGITDALTEGEINTRLSAKADKATTLAGYGIGDAYTKTEVDNIQTTLQGNIDAKLGTNSTIDGGTFGV